MPALNTDGFMKVGLSTATTLSAPGYTIAGTSINVGSTSNWPTDTGVVFAIDEVELVNGEYVRVTGTYNIFRGVVAGATQITNMVYAGGDANRNYSAGSTTRVYILVSSYNHNRLIDTLLTSLDQDGTLKDGAVEPAKWTNPYAFRVYLNQVCNHVNGVFTKITFNAESYDTNNNWDAVTNYRYTVPVNGIYAFCGAARSGTGTSGGLAITQMNKNGVVYSQGSQYSMTGFSRPVFADTATLVAGDTIDFYVRYDVAAAAITNGTAETYFSGWLIATT